MLVSFPQKVHGFLLPQPASLVNLAAHRIPVAQERSPGASTAASVAAHADISPPGPTAQAGSGNDVRLLPVRKPHSLRPMLSSTTLAALAHRRTGLVLQRLFSTLMLTSKNFKYELTEEQPPKSASSPQR